MCQQHFEAASFKGTAEKIIGCLGVVGGTLFGLLAVVVLMLRWEGDGGILAKLFVGAIFGFGMFIMAWWIISILIAPLFAVAESKEARNAVRIVRYRPWDQMVQLEFRNERVAELMQSNE